MVDDLRKQHLLSIVTGHHALGGLREDDIRHRDIREQFLCGVRHEPASPGSGESDVTSQKDCSSVDDDW